MGVFAIARAPWWLEEISGGLIWRLIREGSSAGRVGDRFAGEDLFKNKNNDRVKIIWRD